MAADCGLDLNQMPICTGIPQRAILYLGEGVDKGVDNRTQGLEHMMDSQIMRRGNFEFRALHAPAWELFRGSLPLRDLRDTSLRFYARCFDLPWDDGLPGTSGRLERAHLYPPHHAVRNPVLVLPFPYDCLLECASPIWTHVGGKSTREAKK